MNINWLSIKPEAICLTAPYLIFRLFDPQKAIACIGRTENVENILHELFYNYSFNVDTITHMN